MALEIKRIQLRRDTIANWTTVDPILAEGEYGYETDTGYTRIGDGSSTFTQLPRRSGNFSPFETMAALVADTTLTTVNTSENDILMAGTDLLKVAATGASDHHLTNASGVKFYVISALSQSHKPTTGTGNAYTLTSNQSVSTYWPDQSFLLRIDRTNTGNATLNVDGIGVKAWKFYDETDTLSEFAADGILIGDTHLVSYDGTQFVSVSIMKGRNQVRSDTLANWTSSNPVLAVGEHGFETDTGYTRIGDGSTAFLSLSRRFGGYIVYDDVPALLASTEASRAVGAIWPAGGRRFEEVTTGETTTNAAGVKFIELPPIVSRDLNSGHIGADNYSSATFILGDSITEASGASSYPNGYAFQFARSIINKRLLGGGDDAGYGYHIDINQANAIHNGYTSDGSLSTAGITGDRRSLAAGQKIDITERSFTTVYVAYDATASSGSILIKKNGATLDTRAVAGSGLVVTAATVNEWAEDDTLTIEASGGTIVVAGVYTLKTSTNANLLYIAGKSGSAYQDFTDTDSMDEIAFWTNQFRASNPHTIVLNLGTNNLYNAGKAKTPDDMVTEITALITGLDSRITGDVRYIVAVPPKANHGTFPLIKTAYQYEDYVDAIVTFATDNGYDLMRNDLSALSRDTGLYSDGVHPDDEGHRVMASTLCDVFKIPFNPELQTAVTPQGGDIQADITMNDTWRPFTNNTLFRGKAHRQGNFILLSGIIEPNGSVATLIGTLPAGYRPVGRTTYHPARDDAGFETITITPAGAVTVGAVPGSWLSLEGIMFPVTRT